MIYTPDEQVIKVGDRVVVSNESMHDMVLEVKRLHKGCGYAPDGCVWNLNTFCNGLRYGVWHKDFPSPLPLQNDGCMWVCRYEILYVLPKEED